MAGQIDEPEVAIKTRRTLVEGVEDNEVRAKKVRDLDATLEGVSHQ